MSPERQTPTPVLDLRQLEGTRREDHNGAEPVSPELALVDPELAERARARLPDEAERQRRAPRPHAPERPQRRRASRTIRMLRAAVALVFAGTLVWPALGLLAGDSSTPSSNDPRLAVRGAIRSESPRAAAAPATPAPKRARPARAKPQRAARAKPQRPARATPQRAARAKPQRAARAKPQRAARAKPQRPAAPSRRVAPSRPAARTFVWVPVKGADAYEVQFFRGGRRVLFTRTARPRLVVLPGRASGPRRRFVLEPGAYRWYVWPLFRTSRGVRRGDAIVQAKLVVPA